MMIEFPCRKISYRFKSRFFKSIVKLGFLWTKVVTKIQFIDIDIIYFWYCKYLKNHINAQTKISTTGKIKSANKKKKYPLFSSSSRLSGLLSYVHDNLTNPSIICSSLFCKKKNAWEGKKYPILRVAWYFNNIAYRSVDIFLQRVEKWKRQEKNCK